MFLIITLITLGILKLYIYIPLLIVLFFILSYFQPKVIWDFVLANVMCLFILCTGNVWLAIGLFAVVELIYFTHLELTHQV